MKKTTISENPGVTAVVSVVSIVVVSVVPIVVVSVVHEAGRNHVCKFRPYGHRRA